MIKLSFKLFAKRTSPVQLCLEEEFCVHATCFDFLTFSCKSLRVLASFPLVRPGQALCNFLSLFHFGPVNKKGDDDVKPCVRRRGRFPVFSITTAAGVLQMNKHNCQQCRLTRLTVTQTVGEITHQRNHAILTLNRDLRNYRAAEAKQTQNTIFF